MKPMTLERWRLVAIIAIIGVIVLIGLHFYTWEWVVE